MGVGVMVVWVLGLAACGTYQDLKPEAQSVTATTTRPAGRCKSLGNLTGKGGGASGGYVSNESLIEYALNDLRNQAGALGATHVVYSTPSMGGNQGTTTSAMVMGEALRCEAGEEPNAPARQVASAKVNGCQYDTQCKGDRVCVNGQCISPASSSKSESAVGATTSTPPSSPGPDDSAARQP